MHLAQSRFVALKDKAKRTMTFEDLRKDDDPTRIQEQLVSHSMPSSSTRPVRSPLPGQLPLRVHGTDPQPFPLHGILSSLYTQYPRPEDGGRALEEEDSHFEKWDQPTPTEKWPWKRRHGCRWLQGALGKDDLVNVLDPAITLATGRKP